MADRVQRYRVTAEIVLKDRGDYFEFRRLLGEAIKGLEAELEWQAQVDYIAIEKVKQDQVYGPHSNS